VTRHRPPNEREAKPPSLRRRLGLGIALLAVVSLIAVLWFLYAPPEWSSPHRLGQLLRSAEDQRLGALAVCCVYALLATAFVPITALITATALVFDPLPAFAYAMCGSLLSAALSRGLGQLASGVVLRRMTNPKLRAFADSLREHTFSATVAARLLPLGNFSAINLFAGALAVPWLPFMLGNVAGMVFGVAGFTLLAGRLAAAWARPTPLNLALSVAVVLAVLGVSTLLARLVRKRRPPP
jgi:phospholipase D1/2